MDKVNLLEWDTDTIYKGDGVTTCKWCGNTGWMHTFVLTGLLDNDAPCVCIIGQKVLQGLLNNE
jgi:hypothetical protein